MSILRQLQAPLANNPLTAVISAVVTGKEVIVKCYSTFYPLLIVAVMNSIAHGLVTFRFLLETTLAMPLL